MSELSAPSALQEKEPNAAEVPPDGANGRIRRGTAAFHYTNLALFAAGFATFALLYCVQPLLPVFAREFSVSPAESSLALSATTGMLALAMLVASSISEFVGRKPVMLVSLLTSALLVLVSGFVTSWHHLVLLRALAGIAFSGLPAVAMAYVSEEMDRGSIGLAMGLYIGGSALGGLGGRAISGIIADLASWRASMVTIGVIGLICGIVLWRTLPASRNFRKAAPSPRKLVAAFVTHLSDAGLCVLFLLAFLLMGSFVCIYNYMGFRLLQPPFSLSQLAVSLIFAVYLSGIVASAVFGDLSGRFGRGLMLGLAILIMLSGVLTTLSSSLPVIVLGLALMTAGFFGAHSIASSWVGSRALHAKAQASSLYLFAYYLGSSAIGTLGAPVWTTGGWDAIVAFISLLVLAGLACAIWLGRVARPLPS